MIRNLSFSKFKSFKDETHIGMSPLTILVGPNGSGKSSILRLLALLRQSFSIDSRNGLLVYDGPIINAAGFKALSFFHQCEPFAIDLEIDSVQDVRLMGRDEEAPSMGKLGIRLMITESGGGDSMTVAYEGNDFKFELVDYDMGWQFKLPFGTRNSLRKIIESSDNRELLTGQHPQFIQQGSIESFIDWYLSMWLVSRGSGLRQEGVFFSSTVDLRDENNPQVKAEKEIEALIEASLQPFLNELNRTFGVRLRSSLQEAFGHITYLGPVRKKPERYYSAGDLDSLGLGFLRRPLLGQGDQAENVHGILDYLGMPYELDIMPLGDAVGTGEVWSVRVRNKRTGLVHNFADVGFGLSQILSLVLTMSDIFGGLTLIEQPELHLHPKSQAQLGKSLAWTAKRQNFMIETHSEHLIRGVQVSVANGTLRPEDVSVYYVSQNEKGESTVRDMQIDDRGYFSQDFPDGFFDQGYKLGMELLGAKKP